MWDVYFDRSIPSEIDLWFVPQTGSKKWTKINFLCKWKRRKDIAERLKSTGGSWLLVDDGMAMNDDLVGASLWFLFFLGTRLVLIAVHVANKRKWFWYHISMRRNEGRRYIGGKKKENQKRRMLSEEEKYYRLEEHLFGSSRWDAIDGNIILATETLFNFDPTKISWLTSCILNYILSSRIVMWWLVSVTWWVSVSIITSSWLNIQYRIYNYPGGDCNPT